MQHQAIAAIDAANWEELTPRLQNYAHYQIVGLRWRGLPMAGAKWTDVTINNQTAADLVEEALVALARGRRTYRSEESLEKNLCMVIWSLARNHYKRAMHSPVVNHLVREDEEDLDPIDQAADPTIPANPAEATERLRRQQEFCALLTKSVEGDEELSLLLLAYEDGSTLPAAVEEATGIPAGRVSELKRKLETRADKLIRQNPQYADIKPLQEVS